MDWNKQAEETIKNWTGTQQKMWESWLDAMRGMSPTSPSNEAWQKSVDVWSDSVKNALEAQVTWTRFWADSVASNANSPKEIVDWSKQVLDMMQRWTETQTQLSENWFDAVKKSDPSTLAKGWNNDEAQKMMHTWQEASQKFLEAQMGWLRLLTATQAQKKA